MKDYSKIDNEVASLADIIWDMASNRRWSTSGSKKVSSGGFMIQLEMKRLKQQGSRNET